MYTLAFDRRLLVLALLPLFSPAAGADTELEEIIVTADFRERALAEVPASVAVLDRQAIEERAVQHFEELVFAVPNLNWSGDGNRARYLQIRGVGELEQYEGAPNPSVGFLIDDIDFSGIGGVATLFDVERVEVLKGPQGSRYGANALAGLVYVQSAEPTDDWQGRVRITAAEDNALAGGVAVGGPLTEGGSARFRFSAHHHESDGFRRNTFLGRTDTNGRQETTVRGKIDWRPGRDWSVRIAAMHIDLDDGYDAFALDNGLTVLSDKPGRDAQKSTGMSLRAVRTTDRFELTSLTSFARSDIDFSFDADWGNEESWLPFTYDFESASLRERRTLSQEIRFASGPQSTGPEWLIGVYGLALDDELATDNRGVYDDPIVFQFSDSLDEQFASDFSSTSIAAFGRARWQLGDRNALVFGIRVENRNVDYEDSAALRVSPDETMFGGELTLTHTISQSASAYASLSRGYKAGGFNLGILPETRREFDAETVWSAELGLKSSWLQRRVTANAALFFNRREDQQVRTSFQANPNDPASFVFFTDNAARGETVGLEADLRWFVSDALEIYGNAGWLDAEFDTFTTPERDLSGRAQAHAPGYSLAAGAAYRHPRGFFARIDMAFRDAFYFDVSHDQRSESYELANARLGYEGEYWKIQLWARNLFDENYAVRGFFFGNEPPNFAPTLYVRRGDPRQVGLTLERTF